MHIYIYIHMHTCTCTYVCMYNCTYLYVCMHVCICVNNDMHIYVCMYVWRQCVCSKILHVCAYTHICVCMHTFLNFCPHTCNASCKNSKARGVCSYGFHMRTHSLARSLTHKTYWLAHAGKHKYDSESLLTENTNETGGKSDAWVCGLQRAWTSVCFVHGWVASWFNEHSWRKPRCYFLFKCSRGCERAACVPSLPSRGGGRGRAGWCLDSLDLCIDDGEI